MNASGEHFRLKRNLTDNIITAAVVVVCLVYGARWIPKIVLSATC